MSNGNEILVYNVLCLAAVLAALAGGYALNVSYKALATRKKISVINAAITDYFRKSDIEVTISGMRVPGTDRYVVLIESEPMKQMRLSHIIESSLRDLMHNLHQIELDKIYWRFPIKSRPDSGAAKRGLDEYMTEGLSYRHLPKAEVMEASWENFEQASTDGPKPPK